MRLPCFTLFRSVGDVEVGTLWGDSHGKVDGVVNDAGPRNGEPCFSHVGLDSEVSTYRNRECGVYMKQTTSSSFRSHCTPFQR